MKNVFVSYRHVEPDQSLARFIVEQMMGRGLHVFLDTQLLVGTEWAAEIERQIRDADFFIVLLSKDSIRSDMVRREVKLAHQLRARPERPVRLLPVRVAFTAELPYDLGAYLDPIQYALWKESDPFHPVADQLIQAIEQSAALPQPGKSVEEEAGHAGVQALAKVIDERGAPLPAADPRLAMDTGAIKLSSPFYVRRQTDEELERQLQGQGTTTVVKGPRQVGKSSLLARAHALTKRNGHRAFYIDFQLIDASHLESLDALLRHLARKMAREFKTGTKPDELWDDSLGAIDNMTDFIEQAILDQVDTPTWVLFDEADNLFNQSYRDSFFGMIRGWHNARAIKDQWNNLNIIIAHSTEPSLWIQDLNQSPFNVGHRIRLEDFDMGQVSDLNERYNKPLKSTNEIQELMILVGGQPFLVRQALYSLVSNRSSLAELQKSAIDERGPFGDHLRRFVWFLQKNKDLCTALRMVLQRGGCDDESHFQRLKAAGLVRGESRDAAAMHCDLYSQYFKRHL